jgi:integrase
VDALRAAGQHDEAGILASVAQGKATPLDTYTDAWLAEGGARGPVTARTTIKYRAILGDLKEWLTRERHPVLIEAVTKDVAGRWVTSLLSAGVHSRTINAKVSAMSSYWRWLMKRTSIRQNPWANQAIAQYQKPGAEKSKRAYTGTELVKLLSGKTTAELHDAIRIAALSGMRLDEIYRLKVKDCQDGLFNVPGTKSHAAVRTVPVHSGLVDIIAARTTGKNPGDYVIHEAGGDPKPGRERSMLASKRFATYRLGLGLTDKSEDVRQDRLDFHSLRRWFVTAARASNDLSVVQRIVGHATGNITDDVYSDGPSMGRLRACIESVQLPTA